jgi:hypothetical protein
VIGRPLTGFDGALYSAPKGKKGWGMFYNPRSSFTLAYEFGHYLMHRLAYPDGNGSRRFKSRRIEEQVKVVASPRNQRRGSPDDPVGEHKSATYM